jgi:tetratricopeptide (TPR) repeat protein
VRAYLKRHLFDGDRLRRRTLQEFAVAMRSGRMIVFAGSYATQDIKYPVWQKFVKTYAAKASAFLNRKDIKKKIANGPNIKLSIKAIERLGKEAYKSDNSLTALSVIEHAIAYLDDSSLGLRKEFDDTCVKTLFDFKRLPDGTRNARLILDSLGVDRIITINYDLEFEWHWMTTADERKNLCDEDDRRALFQRLIDDKEIIEDIPSRTLVRILPSGRSVISDTFSRERIDRLIEFSIGSADYDAHILHLHGIARYPETMVISQADYNRQYRRSGITKLPFQHGLRVLFSGNPIIFVGAGMTEGDVTATLEQIVSDHPDRRIAPAFLIWNAPPTPAQRDEKRFTWFHRFGVLTLFDDELCGAPVKPASLSNEARFHRSIVNLGKTAERLVSSFAWRSTDLRDISVKFTNPTNLARGRYDAWPAASATTVGSVAPQAAAKLFETPTPISFIHGRPGTGRGSLARLLRERWEARHPIASKRRSMLIHASFVFEVESVFSLLSGLENRKVASREKPRKSRKRSVEDYMKRLLDPSYVGPEILIIISGMERFFSPAGQPLSAELDGLLRSLVRAAAAPMAASAATTAPSAAAATGPGGAPAATAPAPAPAAPAPLSTAAAAPSAPPVVVPPPAPATAPRWPFSVIAIGTRRVQRYFKLLELEMGPEPLTIETVLEVPFVDPSNRGELPSIYYRRLADRFERGGSIGYRPISMQKFLIARKRDAELSELRRTFYAAYLRSEALGQAGVDRPDLCLEILTAMAFIGQPVENVVPFHAPRVQAELNELSHREAAKRYLNALDQLERLELISPRAVFENCPPRWRRFGLHRSLLTELRDRVGVPLSDSKLAGGFNISLFAAQPVDGFTPEPEIHDDLTSLVDWLIGAYKDGPAISVGGIKARSGAPVPPRQWPPLPREWERRARPHASACLRAALAMVRNYYSTSALLALEKPKEGAAAERDAPMTEHVELLDRLIAAAMDTAIARRAATRHLSPAHALGPPPFYPDDLVWLHNERGVAKLTQGDLYEARHAFDEAFRLNETFVEFGDRGPNWRRIMLNQVQVDIERAKLDTADRRMSDIQESLRLEPETLKEITDNYGCGPNSDPHVVDPKHEHDTILTVGLLHGFRALSLHLRGELSLAGESFRIAVSVLENIGEQRAYAMFQRHFALLDIAVGRQKDEALRRLKLAIASAEATRQTDIAHQARVSEAWHDRTSDESAAARALLIRRLQQSLGYAEASDMHRIRVETGMYLARVKFEAGDFDAALEKVADAVATAARYGMSLRKISLRILMGQILMRRGDRMAGSNLIEQAMRHAERVGYQGAVGLAQRVQAREENPLVAPQL